MSTVNGAIEKKDTFLQHVSLKNYKSIKDVEIEFKPGLNIIIGKNASGKTNFISGLDKILSYEYNEILTSEFTIDAQFKNNKISIRKQPNIKTSESYLKDNHRIALRKIDVEIEINGNKIDDSNSKNPYPSPIYQLSERGLYFEKVIVQYGVIYDNTYPLVNLPFAFTVLDHGEISEELLYFVMVGKQTKLVNSFFERLYKFLFEISKNKDELAAWHKELKTKIIAFSDSYFQNINHWISLYSPIQSVRLNTDFNIVGEQDELKQSVTNLYLEFLIEQSWLPFSLLSDGTKRLFYIISEVLATYSEDNVLHSNDLNIVLIEEPELGIHPHQLHQLMQFIKEQSREKQIIITTHSPQVLDSLEPDELDRIIICSHDSKNGTQLNHLSDKQVNKAKKYLREEAFLSDYWRFSDLEPAS